MASQGPLWAPGGERGLYKSTDGGATWSASLEISGNTGVSDVVLDPRDPDVVYAASYQRRRRQWGLVAGGPESRVYKSTDGGESWRMLGGGLPEGDIGRIGLALSPQNPDVVYGTIAAADDNSGFYRSDDRGESWEKTSDYVPVDPQYYMEIFPDPHREGRVYLMDVWIHVSDDGGETFEPLNSRHKHVDNHALLFDPEDPDYLLVGCDGGIYESWDRGRSWSFIDNLPVTQFYRVGLDNDEPFYNVYGGTQDNDSEGGPSRTANMHGIRNSDWFITVGGDGYQTRVDPDDPDVLYSMWQYGGLVRYDRSNGEILDIQPQPQPGEAPLIWNWDSPLLISPHSASRLYFAGNRLFRSDDRGDSWTAVSPDLSRQLDRNRLEMMGTVWSVDSVWKNVFTSFYGSIVALDESPLVEGLLYAGTELGLFFSRDGGGRWIRLEGGVPVVAFRDLEIQRRENDLVAASFGRGFYILDDYTPLRHVDDELLAAEAALFPVKDAWLYVPAMPLGWGEKAVQGDGYFTAPNPPFGAVFTYYLSDQLRSRREARRDEERDLQERGEPVFYPEWEALRAEDREEDPAVLLVVSDARGNVVRRVEGPVEAGLHRVAWDLRYPPFEPTAFEVEESPWGPPPSGPLAPPGDYTVRLAKRVDGELSWLGEARSFRSVPLGAGKLGAEDRQALAAFQAESGALLRAVLGAVAWTDEAFERLRFAKRAIDDTSGPESDLAERARRLEHALRDQHLLLTGDRTVRRRREPVAPSIVQRIERVTGAQWGSTATPSGTHRRNFEIAQTAFREVLARLGELEGRLTELGAALERSGAPWTPGRGLPEYE